MHQKLYYYHKIFIGDYMKDLPKVYEGKVSSDVRNTQDLYYGNNINKDSRSNISIVKKINNIFKSKDYVYKKRVTITLKDKVVEKTIVGKNNVNLITIDGELIRIVDIIDIK